jgi:3-oxoacyl-[acyl-carrier-protein] synthase II
LKALSPASFLLEFMREVVCTGIALQSALGDLETTWAKLLARETGISKRQVFPDLPDFPVAMIGAQPVQLDSFTCAKGVHEVSLKENRLTTNLTTQLLADAGWQTSLLDCPVIIGSSRAYQPQWEQFAQSGITASILDYLPHMPAIEVARLIGSTSAVLAPMAACATGIWAIERGYQMIINGADRALVGAVEAPISPLTVVGFQQMGAMATDGCYPFDKNRQGLVLGEGGAFFALEERSIAKARGAKIYGQILGCGLTNDASHAWGVGGGAGAKAVQQCLERSGLKSVDHIHLHGTSTQLNDRYEASLVAQFFPGVAVTGNKGAVGHTLGAAAAISVALAFRSLQDQVIPPTVGCSDLEFDLNLIRQPTATKLQNLMCWSFGFGGQNAVIALGI